MTVIHAKTGWSGPEHNHGDRGHEEVYILTEGAATVTGAGESGAPAPGDTVRYDPDATRQVRVGDNECPGAVAGA